MVAEGEGLGTLEEKILFLSFFFFKYFIYLFLERGEGWEKERERNTDVREIH